MDGRPEWQREPGWSGGPRATRGRTSGQSSGGRYNSNGGWWECWEGSQCCTGSLPEGTPRDAQAVPLVLTLMCVRGLACGDVQVSREPAPSASAIQSKQSALRGRRRRLWQGQALRDALLTDGGAPWSGVGSGKGVGQWPTWPHGQLGHEVAGGSGLVQELRIRSPPSSLVAHEQPEEGPIRPDSLDLVTCNIDDVD